MATLATTTTSNCCSYERRMIAGAIYFVIAAIVWTPTLVAQSFVEKHRPLRVVPEKRSPAEKYQHLNCVYLDIHNTQDKPMEVIVTEPEILDAQGTWTNVGIGTWKQVRFVADVTIASMHGARFRLDLGHYAVSVQLWDPNGTVTDWRMYKEFYFGQPGLYMTSFFRTEPTPETESFEPFSLPLDITPGFSAPGGAASPTTSAPTEPQAESNEIRQQIDRIRNGPHEALPPAQAAASSLGGQTGMSVTNRTSCTLSVFVSGPANKSMQLPPGGSQSIGLVPGNYELAASVSCPNVIPFYGTQTLAANTQYSENFYIANK